MREDMSSGRVIAGKIDFLLLRMLSIAFCLLKEEHLKLIGSNTPLQ